MQDRVCRTCTNHFRALKREVQRGRGVYCSRLCANRGAAERGGALKHAEAVERRGAVTQPVDHRVIVLSNGNFAKVDIEDYEAVGAMSWMLHRQGYASSTTGFRSTRRHHYMHRVVLSRMLGRDLTRGEVCDHKNHDKLDNRRRNLRLATVAMNGGNMRLPAHNTSGYKGVKLDRRTAGRTRPWVASIKIEKLNRHIGMFATAEDAAYAYDQWAMQLFGEFAHTNFEYV